MRLIGLVLALLLLAGCGGDDGDGGTASDGGGTPLPPETSAPPTSTMVEPAACRSTLGDVERVLAAMQSGNLDKKTFLGQYDRLEKLRTKAGESCSPQVLRPLDRGLAELEVARDDWADCAKKCPMGDISSRIYAGQDLVYRSVEVANRET